MYWKSLSFRVTFWVSLTVTVIVSIHLYIMRPEQRFLEQKSRESERIANIIQTHLLAEMSAGEPDNIQNHMQLLPGLEGIRRVEILDPQTVVHFSSDETRVGRHIDLSTDPDCRACHDQTPIPSRIVRDLEGAGRVFVVNHVLSNDPQCQTCHPDSGPTLGNILVELEFTQADLAALATGRRLLITGAGLLVVMLLGMTGVIHVLVGRPAAALRDKMMRLESGEFHVGEPRSNQDELGQLDRVFHRMVEQLRALYAGMESELQERTEKLYETQAQVMHQEKLAGIGQLAAGVAHEIGNPLTAIDAVTQLLAMESEDPVVRERIATIQRQVTRISEIVHSMADLSKPLSMDEQPVDVSQVIHAVLGLVRYDFRFRHIDVQVEQTESLPRVTVVEDRLFGVFLNLVLNAADAMPEGGTLSIGTSHDGEFVIVEIADTGHGIAPEDLEKIFEAYHTTKERGKGTGLGLSVSRSYLHSIDGDIVAERRAPQGARFLVRIPIVPSRKDVA